MRCYYCGADGPLDVYTVHHGHDEDTDCPEDNDSGCHTYCSVCDAGTCGMCNE